MKDVERLRIRSDEIARREFDGESIVLDKQRSTYLSANSTATVLWRLLEEWTTEHALVQALLSEFDVSEDRATADVQAFLEDCRARELLIEEK